MEKIQRAAEMPANGPQCLHLLDIEDGPKSALVSILCVGFVPATPENLVIYPEGLPMDGLYERIFLTTSDSATYFIADRQMEIPPEHAERLAKLFQIPLTNIRDATLIIIG